jgi:hypothetical protein
MRPYLAYFFVSAPLLFVSLPFALWNGLRRDLNARKVSPLVALAVIGLFADLLLYLNYSTAVNWRYFLTGLPAIAPLSANFLLGILTPRLRSVRVAFAMCVSVVLALAIVFFLLIRPASQHFVERRTLSKEYRYQLANVPRDAIMISGSQTIAVTYWKAMGMGDWKTIGTGGGWPGDNLVPLIEGYLKDNRRVFLDTDPRWWLPCGWQRDEIPAIVRLQEQFRLRRVTDTIYELRPPFEKGMGADDHPHLEKLLPENRPEDRNKCTPISP